MARETVAIETPARAAIPRISIFGAASLSVGLGERFIQLSNYSLLTAYDKYVLSHAESTKVDTHISRSVLCETGTFAGFAGKLTEEPQRRQVSLKPKS
jgi:hypothetical protein